MYKRGRRYHDYDKSGELHLTSIPTTFHLLMLLLLSIRQKSGSEQISGLNLQLEYKNELLKTELGLAQKQIASLTTSLATVS